MAKISEEQVCSILKTDPSIPAWKVGLDYDLADVSIRRIRQRKVWKSVVCDRAETKTEILGDCG